MNLNPQDLLVLLKVAANPTQRWTYAALGEALAMSASETHASVKRAVASGLADSVRATRDVNAVVNANRALFHRIEASVAERGFARDVNTPKSLEPVNRHKEHHFEAEIRQRLAAHGGYMSPEMPPCCSFTLLKVTRCYEQTPK